MVYNPRENKKPLIRLKLWEIVVLSHLSLRWSDLVQISPCLKIRKRVKRINKNLKVENHSSKQAQPSFTLPEFQIRSWHVGQKKKTVKIHINVWDFFNSIFIQKNPLYWIWCSCVLIFPPSWPRKWTTWSRAGLWAPRWTSSTTWGYTEEQSIMVWSHCGQLTSKGEPVPFQIFKLLKC